MNLYLNNQLVTDLVIPNNVTNISSFAFEGYNNLTSVTIPQSVTSIGIGVFIGCKNLKNITVDKNNAIYKSIDGNLYTKDGTEVIAYLTGDTRTTYTIPHGVKIIRGFGVPAAESNGGE